MSGPQGRGEKKMSFLVVGSDASALQPEECGAVGAVEKPPNDPSSLRMVSKSSKLWLASSTPS